MKTQNYFSLKIQPTVIAIIIFIILVFSTIQYTSYKKGQWEKDIRAELLNFITGKKSNLEKALFSRIYYTRGVAAYVALHSTISNEEFAELAKEYIKNDSVISTMALSKNCVLKAIFPLEGHEAALGLDLLAHPERKEMVEKTIETQLTFVAGPVELIEGGIAFISYTPIFDKTKKQKNNFWGVTDIVIKQNSLFQEAKLNHSEAGYNLALKGENGSGDGGNVFWGDEDVFDNNPVIVKIELPIGNWVLAAEPSYGWNSYPNQEKVIKYILFISALIISVLIWLFSNALLKIRTNEKELKAVFDSLDSLIIECNTNGDYLKITSTNEALLVYPKEVLLGKNMNDIFEPEKAELFKNAIQKCVSQKKLVVIEYPLQIRGEERWFTARISYKSENTAIFNAYDITARKKQEELLIQSEKQLKELNEMKNKFFSIIAHDLRGPLGTHKTIIDLVLDEYDNLDEYTRKDLINSLQGSSNNLYSLLENLLKWSLSQSGKLKMVKQRFNLNEHCCSLVSDFQKTVQLKNIQLVNELNDNVVVLSDSNIAKTILRNLISNAIKFTKPEGIIKLSSEEISNNGNTLCIISVSDTGVGISPEIVESLFRMDKTHSTRGTANEVGNGIGLLLCQELAEKLGTTIRVSSIPDKGSTFSFVLPTSENGVCEESTLGVGRS